MALDDRTTNAPTASGTLGQRLFRWGSVGALLLEVLFIAAVLGGLILYVDVTGFLRALTSPETLAALRLTIITVTVTTALSVLLAVPAAYVLCNYRLPLKSLIDVMLDLPIVFPPVAAGLALLILFGYYLGDAMERVGLYLPHTPTGIVVAQFFGTMTFAVRSVKAALDSVNPRLPAVARTLGSSEWRAFRRVTLPLARNGLIAGAVMTWARCIGLFGPVVMFCGTTRFRTEVLPTGIYLDVSTGRLDEAVAVTLLLLIFAVITLLAFKRLGGQGYLW